MNDGVLLVDLDGTLYAGDGPIRRYAAELAALTGDAALPARVAEYLAGGTVPGASDGWEAVRSLAADAPLSLVDTAFLRARAGLADGTVPVTVPGGFADLLAELRGRYLVVLATNSPRDGLLQLLERLGVRGLFHEIVFSARKPTAVRPLLARLLDTIGAAGQPWRALSVGDHWRNDIAPALSAGAVTGYVDRFGRAAGPAHLTGPTVGDLLPGIRRWAADPARFAREHPLAGS
ncbi:HAD family hydrolase [Actinocatenispora rupis]|uniref:FMN phosphatase YigB, HAD superfamily n=1 Tax=Actinocatenispora rupis TaxID=519421 RepID=A0A8J3NB42_9ACTN|nr:HAD family hydrolase [Actinocatenispora rupis]GID12711.1 hypothetical protein Aru02nite_36000 [Actinocatenispora rupis]